MTDMHAVWFRRDLRVHDHAALAAAMASGAPVLPLYIFDPEDWAPAERSGRQFAFLLESLKELDAALRSRGASLVVRVGTARDVLSDLHCRYGLGAIHLHAETGPEDLRNRDQAIRRWAIKAGISIREQQACGPAGPAARTENWASQWDALMRQPRLGAPARINMPDCETGAWPTARDMGLTHDDCPQRQPGGRSAGVQLFRSFLTARGRAYRTAMASPVAAETACSRLSPHLAFGTLSIREVWQAAQRSREAYAQTGDASFAASLDSFMARLKWRCQALAASGGEACPSPASTPRPIVQDGDPRLEAWINGQTGFPYLDACLRSLRATGWLNFRMRAMVMAFAGYHLWMDWKHPATRLAALLTDFEPAIHFIQAERQSGAAAHEVPRIYNPVKQSREQDPDGQFIRRWVPELSGLPAAYIHAPGKPRRAS